MFIDEAEIYVEGGRGGDGCASFRREKYRPRGGPDGGDGAAGGNVMLVASQNRSTLVELQKVRHYRANNGKRGGPKNKTGATGADLEITVPLGTLVKDETGRPLADLVVSGQEFIGASGGAGGRGNASLVREAGAVPHFAEKGEPGQSRTLCLELKLVADVAIVGFPNAGKSTLIGRISRARPKVAEYPFTTIEPQLGVVQGDEIDFVVTEVPGLVPGAHQGKGMGTGFLRHIARAAAILYLVDLDPYTGREPFLDLVTLEGELRLFNKGLAGRTRMVAANKIDLNPPDDAVEMLREECGKSGLDLVMISAATGEGTGLLLKVLETTVMRVREEVPLAGATITYTPVPVEDKMEVVRHRDRFVVKGNRVERMVLMTDWNNDEARAHLASMLRSAGVEKMLKQAGAMEGDEVEIGGRIFEYLPDEG